MKRIKNAGAEWLEADGLGGFASGTVSGRRTRRYHAVLLVATTPPTGRVVLVNGFDAWVDSPSGSYAISSQHYVPDVIHPNGETRIEAFQDDPWPRWTFRLDDGMRIEHELFVPHGLPAVALRWRLLESRGPATLRLRLFLSGRDYHALHHENAAFRFEGAQNAQRVVWHPYPDMPPTIAWSNGTYEHQPEWYRQFLYVEERERALDAEEDLASPGVLRWDLAADEALLVLSAGGPQNEPAFSGNSIKESFHDLRAREQARRARFPSRLDRSADAYLVRRDQGLTIVAGYPWFTDWGRDTFIAVRGLCLATGRLDAAQAVSLAWAGSVSEGMMPNRFADRGETPEYTSVDSALWYVIAAHEYLEAAKVAKLELSADVRETLRRTMLAIVEGYARGTRHQIHGDTDGLLAAGGPGTHLTWMDAKIGDWVVAPRVGKPVEVQALWLNALQIASQYVPMWVEMFERGRTSFAERFWNEADGCLFDVVDVDHVAGKVDATFRPNQIFAVGGLPLAFLEGDRARRVVDVVEARLLTPLGLRSLAPGSPGYAPHYQGGPRERDAAYHEGTAWPWLLGPFVEAWVRVRGDTPQVKREARARFLDPLWSHLDECGLGHLPEIADAEPPFSPRGCPVQAWSLGEALRLHRLVLKTN